MDSKGIDIAAAGRIRQLEEEGQVIHVKEYGGAPAFFVPTPGGTPQPVTIRVAGSYSATHRKARRQVQERALKAKREEVTGDLLDANGIEIAASCILSWEGFTNAGAPFAHSRENAIAMLTELPWIHEQVAAAMVDQQGFLKGSSAA